MAYVLPAVHVSPPFGEVTWITGVPVLPVCVTVNVCPPMVMVPVLLLPVVLADTEYATVPFPVPVLFWVIVIHEALLAALQEQMLVEAVTATVPVLPKELRRELVGEMV